MRTFNPVVYVLTLNDDRGLYKIGCTLDIERRYASARLRSAITHLIPAEKERLFELEGLIHDMMAAFRVIGREIYELGSEQLSLLTKVAKSRNPERYVLRKLNRKASPKVLGVRNAQCVGTLSKREAELVSILAHGHTNEEIAEAMGINEHTVKNYLFRIMDKTGCQNRVTLAVEHVMNRLEYYQKSSRKESIAQ
jgi:DNA-binding CsgD family transcriptional regulator